MVWTRANIAHTIYLPNYDKGNPSGTRMRSRKFTVPKVHSIYRYFGCFLNVGLPLSELWPRPLIVPTKSLSSSQNDSKGNVLGQEYALKIFVANTHTFTFKTLFSQYLE